VVESTAGDDGVLGCITRRVQRLHFPAKSEEHAVEVSLALVDQQDQEHGS